MNPEKVNVSSRLRKDPVVTDEEYDSILEKFGNFKDGLSDNDVETFLARFASQKTPASLVKSKEYKSTDSAYKTHRRRRQQRLDSARKRSHGIQRSARKTPSAKMRTRKPPSNQRRGSTGGLRGRSVSSASSHHVDSVPKLRKNTRPTSLSLGSKKMTRGKSRATLEKNRHRTTARGVQRNLFCKAARSRVRAAAANQRRREKRMKEMVAREEQENIKACISRVKECNRICEALGIGVMYQAITEDGKIVGVKSVPILAPPPPSSSSSFYRATTSRRTPLRRRRALTFNEFTRQWKRLIDRERRASQRTTRAHRQERRSSFGNATTMSLRVAPIRSAAVCGVKHRGRRAYKIPTTEEIRGLLDFAKTRAENLAKQVERETLSLSEGGWKFGFGAL